MESYITHDLLFGVFCMKMMVDVEECRKVSKCVVMTVVNSDAIEN